MSEIDSNTSGQKPHTGILALASVVLSILAVLSVILSIRRMEAVQNLPGCLTAETPKYRLVHPRGHSPGQILILNSPRPSSVSCDFVGAGGKQSTGFNLHI